MIGVSAQGWTAGPWPTLSPLFLSLPFSLFLSCVALRANGLTRGGAMEEQRRPVTKVERRLPERPFARGGCRALLDIKLRAPNCLCRFAGLYFGCTSAASAALIFLLRDSKGSELKRTCHGTARSVALRLEVFPSFRGASCFRSSVNCNNKMHYM